jgi:predicted GIY-YIG superfamily endonuclease
MAQPWKAILLDAASRAPSRPGVYFMLGAVHDLLYIGKAANLRARLRQHADVEPYRAGRAAGQVKMRYPAVRAVRWETTRTEEDAAAREADLIVGLRPPDNAWTDTGTWTYLVVVDAEERWRFDLLREPDPSARTYGCFAHLGKGVIFPTAIACSDGYAALIRLVWAASGDGRHMPSAITRSAPASFTTPVDPSLRPGLHKLFAGTSAKVLDDLAAAGRRRDAFMQPALARDRVAAEGFYRFGSQALRHLRLRHGRPPGIVSQRDIEQLLTDELRPTLSAAAE